MTEEERCPNELLLQALHERSLDGVRTAVESGADVNAALGKGLRALFIAALNGDIPIAAYLVGHGADIHATHPQGVGNALFYAASASNNREMISWLIDKGIPVNSTRRCGTTPLHKALKVMSMNEPQVMDDILLTLKLLLRKGADINAVYRFQGSWSPLRDAVYNNLTPVVKFFLENGADLHACDEGISILLLDAIHHSNTEVCSWIIERGGDVNARMRGVPLIHHAASKNNHVMVEWLYQRGAQLDIADKSGNTLVHCAASHDAVKILQYLVDNGANIQAKNEVGKSALHTAASSHSEHAVAFLLGAHIDVNIECMKEHTPIFDAIYCPNPADEMNSSAYAVVNFLAANGGRLPLPRIRNTIDTSRCRTWQLGLLECARRWQVQYAKGTPLTDVEEESIQRGPDAVKAYLTAMGSTTADQLVFRRKICIVGPSEWGKTSLVKSLTSERPSLVHIDDRTIGIDLFGCKFQKPVADDDPDAVAERHEVTFWDFAGQDVYQVAHALFFSPRTLYVVCVNLESYAAPLEQSEAMSARQGELMMHRFVTQNVLRWLRLIFTRQPDAQFVFVGTKSDRLEDETLRSIVWGDLQSRLHTWKREMLTEIEEAFDLVGNGASPNSALLPDELRLVRRQEREEKLRKLSEQLDSVTSSEWLLASSAEMDAVEATRRAIESVILRSDRSYKMPHLYSQVLQAIKRRRQEAAGFDDAKDRITHVILPFRGLYSWLATDIPGLEADLFVQILRALHDIGDILWYEKESSSFRNLIILDPTVVVDYVKEVVNHTNLGTGTTSADGRLSHEMLSSMRFWKELDEELTYAFKLLLQHHQLAHPADSKTMEWDSDLIVPTYWKTQAAPACEHSSDEHWLSHLNLGPNAVSVRWEYELTAELAETVFDHFAVQSYSPTLNRAIWRNRIDSWTENEFVARVELEQNGASRDVIRLEVLGKNSDVAWRCMRFLVMAMEEVLEDYPGLFVSRYIVSMEDYRKTDQSCVRHRLNDTLSVLEHTMATGRDVELVRASMPWLPCDMAWYIEKAWQTPGKMQEIQLRASVSQAAFTVEVSTKLLVGANTVRRRMPVLWTAEYNESKKQVIVKMLSDLSGECFHEPIVISVPSLFVAERASWIKVGVSIISNVLPEMISSGLLHKAIELATTSMGESAAQGKMLNCLVKNSRGSPANGAPRGLSIRENDVLSPQAAMTLLKDLLTLNDPDFDELRISDLSNLECAATKDGRYVWVSRRELDAPGNSLTPCDPRDSRPVPTPIRRSDVEGARTPTSCCTVSTSGFKVRLTIVGATQLRSRDWRRTYCTWKLVHAKSRTKYASGTTAPHMEKKRAPSWGAVGFTVATIPSLEVLRQCHLVVRLKRPSRLRVFKRYIGKGFVSVGDYLDTVDGAATLSIPLRERSGEPKLPAFVVCNMQVSA